MPRKRIDPDNPPMTDEFLKGFRPVREAAPELLSLWPKKKGRPLAEETKEPPQTRMKRD